MFAKAPQSSLLRAVQTCHTRSPFTQILRSQKNATVKPRFHAGPLPIYRHFSQTAVSKYPRKDSQDKDSINTEATEYSKSGTDDEAARQEDTAYNPNKTDPDDQRKSAGQGVGGNPLEVSPANTDVSKQRPGTEEGAENSSAAGGDGSGSDKPTSGGGSPRKGKKGS
ncbi:MAG: hypothetical protein MMC33_001326 [Icmadophila ericetorum]|nr:hypothetical protein [Icmadophila ericetorum]